MGNISFDEISRYSGFNTAVDAEIVNYTRQINPVDEIGDNVSFGTEAGLFNDIGISSVVCGPGSIDQAHKPDEFISRAQLKICDQMLQNLSQRCKHTPQE